MSNLNIEIKDGDFKIHNSLYKNGGAFCSEYIYHDATLCRTLTMKGVTFSSTYQSGMTFKTNDYDYPSNVMSLSYDEGASALLVLVSEMCAQDFDDETKLAYVLEMLADTENGHVIENGCELFELYTFLKENTPKLFVGYADEHSDVVADYSLEGLAGIPVFATLKVRA